ncbi:MAG: M1 family peptidase, partial [Gemmatimonadales bacterium]
YAKTWRFKHPSPWDFMFAMDHELHRDLGWFWYYWLFTTESVDGSIAKVETKGSKTVVTVEQAGEMPSPVILKVEFAKEGPAIRPMPNAVVEGNTATVTWPVDVWFGGARSFTATLNFGARKIERITLDPGARFPDRDPNDNVWPRAATASAAPAR